MPPKRHKTTTKRGRHTPSPYQTSPGDKVVFTANGLYACTHCRMIHAGEDGMNDWCPDCRRWYRDKIPDDPFWLCANGTVVKMSDMTTSHLQYSIGRIMRHTNWRNHYMEPLLIELKRRKDKERRDDEETRGG